MAHATTDMTNAPAFRSAMKDLNGTDATWDFKLLSSLAILYAVSTIVSMAGMEIFGWASAVGAILMFAFRRRPLSFLRSHVFLPVDFALAGLFFVVVLGAIFKVPPETTAPIDVVGNARWILLFMFLRAALAMTWSDRMVRGLLIFMTVLLAIISAYSIWQYFYGIDLIRGARHVIEPTDFRGDQPIYRAEGVFGSSMTFGNSIALSWCFPIAWLLHGRLKATKNSGRLQWTYVLAAVCSILGLLAILATMTRGVWLSAIAALLVMSAKAHRRGLILIAGAVVLFVGISTVFLPELSGRMQSITDTKHSSNSARVQVWRANFEIFKENPVLGIGYGVNEDVVGEYYERIGITDGFKGHAHNTFLQFLSGTGLLGFLCFATFTIYFLVITWRLGRQSTRDPSVESSEWPKIFIEGAFGAQIAMIVGGLTECNFKDAEVNHQFILILAAVATIYHLTENGGPRSTTEFRDQR